jgi:hypothetical protein
MDGTAHHGMAVEVTPHAHAVTHRPTLSRLPFPLPHTPTHTNTHRRFCPEHYNPVDFYLKQVSFAPGGVPEQEVARMDKLAAAFQASDMAVAAPLSPDDQ